jgi:protein SCO1/2
MRALIAFLVGIMLAGPAWAGVTERDLAGVGIAPPKDARVPTTLAFRDLQGRTMTVETALDGHPGLLIPVDYTCRTVCGPTLAIAAEALDGTGLRPGSDYRLIVVGIDPRDGREEAYGLTGTRIGDRALAASASVLSGDAATVQALLTALGYRTAYDPENDQFAHPSAVVALMPDARVARVLSSLALDPRDLRLALVEAGEGKTGGIGDQLILLCYGFDPVHGIYTPAIRRILQTAGVGTIGTLALVLLVFHRRSRRSKEGAA